MRKIETDNVTDGIEPIQKVRKRNKKRVTLIIISCVVIITLIFSFLLFPRRIEPESYIISETSYMGSITTTVVGTGVLDYSDSIDVLVPNGLKIDKVTVEVGDYVEPGDILAVYESTSILAEIESVEEKLKETDKEINKVKGEYAPTTIYTSISGRVKQIYAEVGEEATKVVDEYGSLMLISIDGRMAVDFVSPSSLSIDEEVVVELADGTEVKGIVYSSKDNSYTVTIDDNGPVFDEIVLVTTKDGVKLGEGELYINQPIPIFASSGRIVSIYPSLNSYVYISSALIKLEGVNYSAAYTNLLATREELSATLASLISITRNNSLTATFSGVVQSISTQEGSTASSNIPLSTAYGNNIYSSVDKEEHDGVTVGSSLLNIGQYMSKLFMNTNLSLSAPIEIPEAEITDVTEEETLLLKAVSPVTGETPKTTFQSTTFNGTIRWVPENSVFLPETIYIAEIALIANAGYRFALDFIPNLGQGVKISEIDITLEDERNQLKFYAEFAKTGQLTYNEGTDGYGELDINGYGGNGSNYGNLQNGADNSGTFGNYQGNTQETPAESDYRSIGFTIAMGETMMLSVEIDELDILSISKGQEASVTFNAIGGKEYLGVITRISDTSSSTGNSARYRISIAIERDELMRAGMNAAAVITISRKHNVVLLPVAAIQEINGREVVFLSVDEAGILSDEREVETGLSDGRIVEIVGGLSENEIVYYRYVSGNSETNYFGGMGDRSFGVPGNFGGGF